MKAYLNSRGVIFFAIFLAIILFVYLGRSPAPSNFDATVATKADLDKDNLVGTNLANTRLGHANFKEADLSKANLTEANLYEASLESSNLSKANLSKANLDFANLKNALLMETELHGANLKNASHLTCEQIQSAKIDRDTLLPDYIYIVWSSESSYACKNLLKGRGVNLKGIDLAKARLMRTQLIDADLSEANLMGADFYEAKLNNSNLTKANLRNASFDFVNMKNAQLLKTELQGANLKNTSNLLCEQILSARIDQDTKLPDYMTITWSSESTYSCENLYLFFQ